MGSENPVATYFGVEVAVYLARERLEGGAAELVRSAIPTHIDQGVEAEGDGRCRGRDDAHVEEDEEIGDGDRPQYGP